MSPSRAAHPDDSAGADRAGHGRAVLIVDVAATGVFAVSATLAATLFTSPMRAQGVAVALALFGVGVAAFLWGFWNAVQRSRAEEIAVTTLFFLAGDTAPRRIRTVMNGCLAAQVCIGLATALARPTTDGDPGSSLAFGTLVPMLGLGLNGLWAAFHGAFPPRSMPVDGPGTGQDGGHG